MALCYVAKHAYAKKKSMWKTDLHLFNIIFPLILLLTCGVYGTPEAARERSQTTSNLLGGI